MSSSLLNYLQEPLDAGRVPIDASSRFDPKIFNTFSKNVEVVSPKLADNSYMLPNYGSSSMPSTSFARLTYIVGESDDFVNLSTSYILLQGQLYEGAAVASSATGAAGLYDAAHLFTNANLKINSGTVEQYSDSMFAFAHEARKYTEFSEKHKKTLESFLVYQDDSQYVTASAVSNMRALAATTDATPTLYGNHAIQKRWVKYSTVQNYTTPVTTAKAVSLRVPLWWIFSYLRATPVIMLQPQLQMELVLDQTGFPVVSSGNADTALRFILTRADLYINKIQPPDSLAGALMEAYRLAKPIMTTYELPTVFQAPANATTSINLNYSIARPRPTKMVLFLANGATPMATDNSHKFVIPSTLDLTSITITMNGKSISQNGTMSLKTAASATANTGDLFNLYQQYLAACHLQYSNSEAPFIDYDSFCANSMIIAADLEPVASTITNTTSTTLEIKIQRTTMTNVTPVLVVFNKVDVTLDGRVRVNASAI